MIIAKRVVLSNELHSYLFFIIFFQTLVLHLIFLRKGLFIFCNMSTYPDYLNRSGFVNSGGSYFVQLFIFNKRNYAIIINHLSIDLYLGARCAAGE